MRLHRRHAIFTGLALAGVALIAVAVAVFSPPVETALLRRSLTAAGATDIRVEGMRFWLRHGSVARVAFRQNGIGYEVRDLAAQYHPFSAWRREANLERVTARSVEVVLDLTAPPPAPSAGAGRPAPAGRPDWRRMSGGVPVYHLPWKVRIGHLALAGGLMVEQNGTAVGTAQWTLEGSLAPGADGTFAFSIRPAGAVFSAANGSTAAGSLRLHEDARGGIDDFGLSGHADLGGTASVAWNGAVSATGSALQIETKSVPLAWANPYLSPHGVAFASGSLTGIWRLAFRDGSVTCSSEGDLHIDTVSVTVAAKPQAALAPLSARIGFEASWRPDRPVVTLRRLHIDAAAGPAHALAELRQPLALDLRQPRWDTGLPPGAELFTLSLGGLSLEAANQWLPGREVHGQLADARVVVRAAAGGEFSLEAPSPWRIHQLVYAAGGRRFFDGDFSVVPSALYGPSEQWVRLADILAHDRNGTVLTGRMGAAWKTRDEHTGGGILLDLQLPSFPGLPEKRGEYHAKISAAVRVLVSGAASLSRFSLQLTGRSHEELMSFVAGAPVQVERSEGGEWLLQSAEPLVMKTAGVPLAGFNPWLQPRGWRVEGAVPATKFNLILQPRRVRLEPATPITLRQFYLERDGEPKVQRALVTITPSFAAEVRHRFFPVFRVEAKVSAALTHGVLSIEDARAGLFDAQIQLEGNERQLHPTDLSGGGWLDLGAIGRIALFAGQRFPGEGHLRFVFGRSPANASLVEFHGAVEDVRARDGKPAPTLRMKGQAAAHFADRKGGFAVDAILEPVPAASPRSPARPSDAHFGLTFDLTRLAVPQLSSRLTSTYFNVDTASAFAAAFATASVHPHALNARAPAGVPSPETLAPVTGAQPPPHSAHPDADRAGPPWGVAEGNFAVAMEEVAFSPYTIANVTGTLEADSHHLALTNLTGEILGGRCTADLRVAEDGANPTQPATLQARFDVKALDAGQAVHLRYPTPSAGLDGKLDLDLTLSGRAASWGQLFAATSGRFTLSAQNGRLHLTLPKQEMMSEALLVGGTLSFSKEMRALGRLLKTLESVPVESLEASGTLAPSGELALDHLRIKSPQLQLDATGDVANAKLRDVLSQPLRVEAALAARGDLATLLDGMHLLDQRAVNGYRALQEPFTIVGVLGQPDLHPLYDLLAKAVQGSHGSWGLLMRTAQSKLARPNGP